MADTRQGWHTPTAYRWADILSYSIPASHPHCMAARAAMAAMNAYEEEDAVVCAMVRSGDAASLDLWADDEVWATIAVETSSDGSPGTYAEDVAQALHTLAASIRGCGCEGKGHHDD